MRAYDAVATRYAAHFADELAHKPLDRALLELFAADVRGQGTVVDLGCGPGQIAAHLASRGVDVQGIDLSPGMVAAARAAVPGVPFSVGDMLALAAPDGAWAGVAAFYAIVHLELAEVAVAARELRRVLRPGGRLLLSFHAGDQRLHLDEWFEQKVDVSWIFHDPAAVEKSLTDAGLIVDATILRRAYVPHEHDSRRAYLLAHRP